MTLGNFERHFVRLKYLEAISMNIIIFETNSKVLKILKQIFLKFKQIRMR